MNRRTVFGLLGAAVGAPAVVEALPDRGQVSVEVEAAIERPAFIVLTVRGKVSQEAALRLSRVVGDQLKAAGLGDTPILVLDQDISLDIFDAQGRVCGSTGVRLARPSEPKRIGVTDLTGGQTRLDIHIDGRAIAAAATDGLPKVPRLGRLA